MSDIRLVKSTDNNLHRQEISTEKCIHCCSYIKVNVVKMPWGSEKRMKQECKCISNEKNERLKRIAENEYNRKIEKLFNQSQLGKKFKESTFENIEITKHNKILVEYLKEFSNNFLNYKDKSFFIYSHGGTGKTLMTSATCNYIMQKYNKQCVFLKASKFVKQIMETYSRDSIIKESIIMNNLKKVDLFILDDLGSEALTEKAEELIFTVIDDRYNDSKATIITSNLSLEELKSRYHTRIFSRIIEMTEGKRFNLQAEKDFRLPENMKK